jgi:hypothetical protein
MFPSFFFAGFECATGVNVHGEWIDQVAATQHDRRVREDYGLVRRLGMRAVREGVRWPLVDRGRGFDFSTLAPFVAAARDFGLTAVWDLFHYGYPSGLDPLSDGFTQRFTAYCEAVARYLARHGEGPWYFTPMNEPSYFSWAAGEVARFAPHLHGRGRELKIALIRTAIRGIDAIRSVLPEARMVSVDPLCRVVAPWDRPDMEAGARHFNECAVFEAWDMLCGRLMPELGGSRRHLDIVGINYYATNQWEIGHEERPLSAGDPRRLPLRALIKGVWQRYGGDLLITETSDVGDLRGPWIDGLVPELEALDQGGIPLHGVCLYPILGMPEWHQRDRWTDMGVWDVARDGDPGQRILHRPTHEALTRAIRSRAKPLAGAAARSQPIGAWP